MGLDKYRNGFRFTVHRDAFDLPLTWDRPRRIFVDSMSDLFHEDMLDATLEDLFRVMVSASQHTFQILTKRPERMARFFENRAVPVNVWLGTSVELKMYLPRLDWLRRIVAKTRFVSFEPLLEDLELTSNDLEGIHWAIVGGESGAGFRPFDKSWARNIRVACHSAPSRVAFFFKQSNGRTPGLDRKLDGRVWEEYPDVQG